MPQKPGNSVKLGQITGTGEPLVFPPDRRDKHLYITGGTGAGKSKLLEYLIRQDILNWSKSKCGLLVIDPHGNLYDGLTKWLAWHKLDRPIVPIDFRQTDWTVSYNLLRRRNTDPAVLVDNLTQAISYVWGQNGITQTPLFARWVGNVLRVLYDNNHILLDAHRLIDQGSKQVRYAMTHDVEDIWVRQDWERAYRMPEKEFELQVSSTVNRLLPFMKKQVLRATFGQSQTSLDLRKALDDGSIILVSLAQDGGCISQADVSLFASLLLTDLWTAATERGKKEGVKPFYVYVDEFQNFVTPTIATNLDQARGFGLHFTLANQFPNQVRDMGENGMRVYRSLMETASSKVVFRLSDEENLLPLAKWLFRGVLNPDEIKHELRSTKIMGYNEEMRTSYTRSQSASTGEGIFKGATGTRSEGGTIYEMEDQDSRSWNESTAQSDGTSQTLFEGETTGESTSSVLMPIMGKELSSVQFRSLDEQLFRATWRLFALEDRQNATRLVGMKAPVSLQTPTVNASLSTPERVKRYLDSCYSKLPFALRYSEAQKQVSDHEQNFAERLLKDFEAEDAPVKRRIK